MRLTGRSLVAAMCVGQLGNMLPHVTVPAVMPQHLMSLWALSAAEAGLMASAFSFGYMVAVPLLTALTDRIDARNILLVGSFALSLVTLAFGLLADGLWTATMICAVAGMGFAGAYMPGLKALTDRLPPGDASRSITLYTSSFSFGVGLSFLVCQHCGRPVRLAMGLPPQRARTVADDRRLSRHGTGVAGAGQAAVVGFPAGHPQSRGHGVRSWLRHTRFELYGIRTWLVASPPRYRAR
jgi:Major Facilitator Superfamily